MAGGRLFPAFSMPFHPATTPGDSLERYLYAVLSGVMLTAAFPPIRMEWIAWLALIPLYKALAGEPPSRAFRLGFVAGFAHFMTLIYWIIVVLDHYGGLNALVSSGILGLFCLYLSLYPAVFSSLVSVIRGSFLSVTLSACLWVSLEYARGVFLTGFPWCLLGYSQYRHLLLIQTADLTGVYGLSFLIVLFNGLIYAVFFDRSFSGRGSLKWETALLVVLALFTLLYGYRRIEGIGHAAEGVSPVKTAVIQGNVDQSVKWDPTYQAKTVDIYERLTKSASASGIELTVWPETAMPFFFQDMTEHSTTVLQTARRAETDLVFGCPAYSKEAAGVRYYNRAYGLTPEGDITGFYDKVHLVPFGEYVPLNRFLPFVRRLVPAAGDFAPGGKIDPLRLPTLSAGILICFEAIFPELARKQTRSGADVLINLTNDAWFGMTSAPYQHLSMSVFRAVENRRPLIRAANTGISAFISPCGKIVTHGPLFEREVLVRPVRPVPGLKGLYTRLGDLFPLCLAIICLIKIFFILCYRWKSKGPGKANSF